MYIYHINTDRYQRRYIYIYTYYIIIIRNIKDIYMYILSNCGRCSGTEEDSRLLLN